MMKTLKRILLVLAIAVGGITTLFAIELLGGHPMGLFSGTRPVNLGFTNGKFIPPSWKPNNVSSTTPPSDAAHYIAPIVFGGEVKLAWQKLVALVKAQPNATVVTEQPSYLYAEFKTPGMGFVDDVEFALDAEGCVIHARSASRLGVRDFGVNRQRIEALRKAFAK